MAIDKGNIKTSANYDVRAQKPMEARREKPRKVDLITKESWSYDGNTVYAHKGLQVWVEEEGKTYVLNDLSKMLEPDYSGWEMQLTDANVAKVATSGQYSDLEGKPTFATVNGKRIDEGGNIVIESSAKVEVDTKLSDTSENAIANSTVSRALAEKQERLMDGVNIKTINGQNVLGRGNITIEGGGGGISEEKEVYIGTQPTEDAKLWIDPTGTPSGGNGGGTSGGVSSEPVITLYLPTFGEDYVDPLEEKYRELNAASFNTIIQYGREKGIIPRIFLLEQEFAYAKENGYEVYGGYIPYQALVIGVGEEIGISFGYAYGSGGHQAIALLPTGEWTEDI